jgi:hypothetical protein
MRAKAARTKTITAGRGVSLLSSTTMAVADRATPSHQRNDSCATRPTAVASYGWIELSDAHHEPTPATASGSGR